MSFHIYNRSISPELRSDNLFLLKGSQYIFQQWSTFQTQREMHYCWVYCSVTVKKVHLSFWLSENLCSTLIINGSMAQCKIQHCTSAHEFYTPAIYPSTYLSVCMFIICMPPSPVSRHLKVLFSFTTHCKTTFWKLAKICGLWNQHTVFVLHVKKPYIPSYLCKSQSPSEAAPLELLP